MEMRGACSFMFCKLETFVGIGSNNKLGSKFMPMGSAGVSMEGGCCERLKDCYRRH